MYCRHTLYVLRVACVRAAFECVCVFHVLRLYVLHVHMLRLGVTCSVNMLRKRAAYECVVFICAACSCAAWLRAPCHLWNSVSVQSS
jgi:hypothetical protein